MEHLLSIDTSTSRASIALACGELIYHSEQMNVREHAQWLLPMIEQLLTQANITIADLSGIVLGQGPGSFTGLRIACSVVKGLAYPLDLPIYPVSSLAAIAEEVFDMQPVNHTSTPQEISSVLTILDARMHEVYWDCYTVDRTHLEEKVSAISQIALPNHGPLIIAGVEYEAYLADLPISIQQRCIEQRVVYPDARAMIRWVRAGRSRAVSVADVQPVYVRNQVTQGASSG
jgi:tRNA threonylcarbamoyladenosine biosynthesis protein TsaB